MNKIKLILMSIALTGMIGLVTPSYSQTAGASNTTSERQDDDGDRDYGWVGLLGLVGLAGLFKKKDVRVEADYETRTPKPTASTVR